VHPYLLHHGHLYLPTFGALAAVGLMLALTLSERTARLKRLPAETLWNAGIFTVVAAFVLSRLLLLVEHFGSFRHFPILLLTVPSLTPSGLILTAAATLLYLRLHRLPILPALDAWAPCATLVWCALALGHFFEGSDPGLPAAHGMLMPGDSGPTYPVALYAAVLAAGLTAFLYHRLARARAHTTALALILAGLAQFALSILRQPSPETLGPLDLLQWTALAMLLAGGLLYALVRPEPLN
jgi:phosphatidylglycerol:prolipoprotein diacylglycerol transferase